MDLAIDLTTRSNLSDRERWSLSQFLQAALLIEMTQAGRFTVQKVAFQGGTCLNVVWDSPRVSEDLDFLVGRPFAPSLDRVMERAAEGVRRRLVLETPGAELEVKRKSRGNLIVYQVDWSHPQRHGKVMAKVEFYQVDADLLARYRHEVRALRRQPSMRIRVDSPLPAATLEAIYADKITAIAGRAFVKHRDIFDLWYLRRQLRVDPDPAELGEDLDLNCRIYGMDREQLADGLRAFLEGPAAQDREALAADLARWLEPGTYEALAAADAFEEMLETTRMAVAQVIESIESSPSSLSPCKPG